MLFILSEDDDDNKFMENLYTEYFPIMFKTALGIIKDEHLANDIVQTAICKLYDKIPRLKMFDSQYLISYVVTTVRSVAIDNLRSLKRKKCVCFIEDFENYDDHIIEKVSQKSPEDYIIEIEDYKTIVEKIKNLPEKKKNLLYMRFILEMDYDEISKTTGLTISNIHVIFHRIKKQLLKGEQESCKK